jgi:membrane associated rhomboid family serine protease
VVLLPIGDAPNYAHGRPWVNWALIAANVAVFLLARQGRDDEAYSRLLFEHGFLPIDPSIPDFFSSMFLHADWMHLGGNMLFLWIFGDNVEGRLGHLGYLLAYLASGLAAVLLFRVLDPEATVPLVGASGAIFGVQGFYFVAFPQNKVKVLFFLLVVGAFWMSARLVIGISFATNLLLMLRPQGQDVGGGVAYAAHVGGAALGAVIALVLAPFTPREEPQAPRWARRYLVP